MHATGIPFGFIVSANPLTCGIDGFPGLGSDAGVDDRSAIRAWNEQVADCTASYLKFVKLYFENLNVQVPKQAEWLGLLQRPLSDRTFTICTYPSELAYYSEAIRNQYRLWQIDSPIAEHRIPAPFQMPAAFEALPGKLVYVSMGKALSSLNIVLLKIFCPADRQSSIGLITEKL